MQFGEIIGLQQNFVCARGLRHQDSVSKTNFESKSEFEATYETGSASETNSNTETDNESVSEFELHEADSTSKLDDDNDVYEHNLALPGTKIPEWFNHQSVGSSISFSIGRKFQTIAFCVALKVELKDVLPSRLKVFNCSIYLSVNGFEKELRSHDFHLHPSSPFTWFHYRRDCLKGIILDDRNDVKFLCKISIFDPKLAKVSIERCGVHVACICPPQNSTEDKVSQSKNS